MRRKSWVAIVLIGVLVVLSTLSACTETTPTEPEEPDVPQKPAEPTEPVEPIELVCNLQVPNVVESSRMQFEFIATELEKRTEGRVKIKILWSSPLAPPPGILDATTKGVFDIGNCVAGTNPGRFPASEISDIPIGYPGAWTVSHALNDWYQEFKPAEWDDVVVLAFVGPAPAVIGTVNKPVRTLEDLKGLTIRVPGGRVAQTMELLGAVPRPMPAGEIAEALSKGAIEGITMGAEAYPGFGRLHESINYVTNVDELGWSTLIWDAMNKESWNKLQPGDRQILADVFLEGSAIKASIVDRDEQGMRGFFKNTPGKEFITLTPEELAKFIAASKPVIDTYISDMNAAGMPGADYVQYYQERIEYWAQQQP